MNGITGAVGLIVIGLLAANGAMWLQRERGGTSADPVAAPTADRHPTTAPTVPVAVEGTSLESSELRPGDCLTWDVSLGPARTDAVSCDAPHLVEVAGSADLDDDPGVGSTYPTNAAWPAVWARDCSSVVERYLGVGLDPSGPWAVGGIRPEAAGWGEGDHHVVCAVVAVDRGQAVAEGGLVPFLGKVHPSGAPR